MKERASLIFWLLFWPVSELFGRPPEADEPILPSTMVAKFVNRLLLAIVVLAVAMVLVMAVLSRCGPN